MMRRLAFLMSVICAFGCCFSAAAEDASVVDEVAGLIASATAEERQEIFGDLVWYMIFVDGADAVESAFETVGMFFAGDSISDEVIPESYAAAAAEPAELTEGVSAEVEDEYAVEVLNACIADEALSHQGGEVLLSAGDGKTCVAVELRFTCLSAYGVVPEDIITCELIYDGKYHYGGRVFTQPDGKYVPGGAVQPLYSEYVTLVFEVPDIVGDSGAPVTVSFAVEDGGEYLFTVR